MKNKKYRLEKDIVLLTTSMFITVFLWIAFNIYNTYVTSTINETLQTQTIPIDGKFDVESIELLKNRQIIEPDYSASPAAVEITPTTGQLPIVEPTLTIIQPGIENDKLP